MVFLSIRAHPHVCGEHVVRSDFSVSYKGSSPRMRGTQVRISVACRRRGLIPTYAGNTSSTSRRSCVARAHPHVCGEHEPSTEANWLYSGSSPRMRGTLRELATWVDTSGLIPTYAGNTPQTHTQTSTPGAHPHVCGEHGMCRRQLTHSMGSSPRMRGTQLGARSRCVCVGLIPTYAGNTRGWLMPTASARAHPHVCGEHLSRGADYDYAMGSSPRMRGTPSVGHSDT